MIKAVIFDHGGVLLTYNGDTLRKNLSIFLKLDLKKINRAYKKVMPYYARGKINEDEFWRRFTSQLKIRIDKSKRKGFLRSEYAKNASVDREVEKFAISIKKSGYKIALLSDVIEPHMKYATEKGWYDVFPTKVLSCQVGWEKPDKKMYSLILKKLKVKPEEAVFIDDRRNHVAGARKIGMKSILFRNARQLKKDLNKLGVHESEPSIKTVIFDCGGVMTTEIGKYIFGNISKKFKLNQKFVRNRFKKIESKVSIGRMTTKEFWNSFSKLLNVNKKTLRNVWYRTLLNLDSGRNEAMVNIVDSLKKSGYTVAMLSNTTRPSAYVHRLKKHYAPFPNVFLSCEIGMEKPDKKIYRFVMNKLKVKPDECVFIDNKERNLVPARELGMKTILFKSHSQLKRDLKKLGVI